MATVAANSHAIDVPVNEKVYLIIELSPNINEIIIGLVIENTEREVYAHRSVLNNRKKVVNM